MKKVIQINFDRNRKTNVPFGWTMVQHITSSGKKVAMWRCPYVHFNLFTQKYERCSYICRKDRTENPHYHEYKISPEEDEGLKENYLEETTQYTNNSFIKQLESITAKFIGETSISVSVTCSNQYCSFLSKIAQLSIDYFGHCKSISKDPYKIIKQFNKNDMKRSILEEGDHAFHNMLKNLSNYRFVNLMIDSATVNTMRVVHTTLSNPFSGLAPLPFRSVKKEGSDWGIAEYQHEIETSLAEIQSFNSLKDENDKIIVTAICHDRLASQSAAISKIISNTNIKLEVGPIVDVSCLNHLIHNSFLCSINKCSELKVLIQSIEELITTLRKREAVEFIGRKMPHPSKTRWLYICDSLLFIIKNIDRINIFLINQWIESHTRQEGQSQEEFEDQAKQDAVIQRDLYELYIILLPLHKASLSFECEQSRLADVIPIFHTLFCSYKKLFDESIIQLPDSITILHELLAQLLARIETYLPQETWACWALSRPGRFQLRVCNAESGIVTGNILDYENETYSINDSAQNMENEIISIIKSVENFGRDNKNIEEEEEDEYEEYEEYEEQLPNNEENEINSADKEEPLEDPPENEFDKQTLDAITYECNLNKKFRERLNDWRTNHDIENMIAFDLSLNTYDKALDCIKHYCKLFDEKCTDEIIENIFDEWLFSNNNIFPKEDMNKPNDFVMWQNFFKHDDLKFISLIALRLLSISTSESDVERLISAHRFLVHDRMSNLSTDVLLARLRLRANAISKNAINDEQ